MPIILKMPRLVAYCYFSSNHNNSVVHSREKEYCLTRTLVAFAWGHMIFMVRKSIVIMEVNAPYKTNGAE